MMVPRAAFMALVAVTALLVQTVVLPAFQVFGWRPDLIALTVVGFGLAEGPQTGARYGFGAGLLVSLASGSGQLLGVASLALVGVGWIAGEARPYLGSSPRAGQIAAAGIASATGVLLQGMLELLLSADRYSWLLLVQGVVVVGLYNALLAPAVVGPLLRLAGRLTTDPFTHG